MTDNLYEIVYQATAERYNISVAEVQARYGGPGVRMGEGTTEESTLNTVVPCDDVIQTIKTFGGKTVEVIYVDQSAEWTAQQREYIEDYYLSEFNNLQVLEEASKMYNCHSYAWYLTSKIFKPCWITSISGYLDDAHSKYAGKSLATVEPGMIAVYRNSLNIPLHSAIVESVNGSTIICVSKWGSGCLFRHELYNVPSDYSSNDSGNSFNIAFYRYEQVHAYGETVNSVSGHERTCAVCNWIDTTPHNNVYVSNGASGHTSKCKICGYTSTDKHTADPLTGKCKFCNYDLSSTPILPTQLQRRKSLDELIAL